MRSYRYERTWLLLHEPIRDALLDFEDLVSTLRVQGDDVNLVTKNIDLSLSVRS